MTRQIAGVTGEYLLQYIQRIERLELDKAAIAEDVKSVFAEAKNNGFDTKIMKQIIRLRKMDENERDEQETLLDIYMQALGMIPAESEAA